MIKIRKRIAKRAEKRLRRKFIKWLLSSLFSSFGGILILIIAVLGLIIGICGAISNSNSDNSSTNNSTATLPVEVEAYRADVTEIASKYDMSEYVDLILAIMAAETGGKGTDVMASAESGYNQKYPHSPGAIEDTKYSIECGIQVIKASISAAKVKNRDDIAHIRVALQGYNFGNGYIADAQKNAGGLWKQEHVYDFAKRYSNGVKRTVGSAIYERAGMWAYGDQHYPDHVLIYYIVNNSNSANNEVISVALSQIGNTGGETFWSWYGFSSRVEWCACFVSWVLNQCKYSEPKFSYCPNGVSYFKSKNKWQKSGSIPSAGEIIFFDWDGDGTSDHVGIVEKVGGDVVYTIEGNSNDVCTKREYPISSSFILGYGQIK